MSGEHIWRVRPEMHYRSLVDGGMLYDASAGQVHHFNAAAALVWEGCEQGKSIEQIAEALCRHFAVDAQRARADVERVLAEFAKGGIVFR